MRDRTGIDKDRPRRRLGLSHDLSDLVSEVVGVGEEELGVETEDDQAGERLRLWVPLDVPETEILVLLAGDPAQDGGVGPVSSVDKRHQPRNNGQAEPLENAKEQHSHQADDGEPEVDYV